MAGANQPGNGEDSKKGDDNGKAKYIERPFEVKEVGDDGVHWLRLRLR